ncbi:uncharacterized protein [Solanum lycopersicum]|uniref:uncharacterized protein n=1 Tax=Solanum lycopersicum TaxID=4081 RepID=UPI003748E6D0
MLRRMPLNFYLSGEVLYRRTSDLDLLRCVDAAKVIEQIHAGVCGTHMNGLTMERKIFLAGYFWMTMENDCCKFVQKYHKCQVHGDLIRVPPHELNAMSSPWTFVTWGMDVIVYRTEAVIPAEVKISSLKIIQEAELSDVEWVNKRIDQLALIDEKRMVAIFHGQLYRQRMICSFHKRVRARNFEISQLVLKRIFPHQDKYKGKFAPNWKGPYMVRKVYIWR